MTSFSQGVSLQRALRLAGGALGTAGLGGKNCRGLCAKRRRLSDLQLRAALQGTEDRPEFGRRWRANHGDSCQAAKTKVEEDFTGYKFCSGGIYWDGLWRADFEAEQRQDGAAAAAAAVCLRAASGRACARGARRRAATLRCTSEEGAMSGRLRGSPGARRRGRRC